MSTLALASACRRPAEPSSLLNMLAGEFAPRIAALWPAPHAEFLAAPADRRHLVFLGLALGRNLAELKHAVLHELPKRALRAVLPDGPAGLGRALGRLGEVAWPADDYRRLLALLGEPAPAKRLRHAEAISPNIVRRMAAMPPPMAGAFELAWELNDDAVALLREAHAAIRVREGRIQADAAAARWAQVRSAKALFEVVGDDLCAELPPPPFAGTERLRPLTSKAEIRAVAKRYGNCLADRIYLAATGQAAYFEWTGKPGAVVEVLRCHVFGWRLDEARGPRNAPVAPALRGEIAGELALMGVHVGRTGWSLERAAERATELDFELRPAEIEVGQMFGD